MYKKASIWSPFLCVLLAFQAINTQAVTDYVMFNTHFAKLNQDDIFNKIVTISKNNGTIYELLKNISEQSGYLFIYDSQVIENDRKVKVTKGSYTLREAIYLITDNKTLRLDLSGEYILLRPANKPNISATKDTTYEEAKNDLFIINGKLFDIDTNEDIIYATVSIVNTSLGITTNKEGNFQFIVPDSLLNRQVRFSHIGYESREIDIALLEGEFINFGLKPKLFELDEVVVSSSRPEPLLNDMLNNLSSNYTTAPVYLTSFYREGIGLNNKNIDLTESVLQVYKTGFKKKSTSDNVKLIKKRRITNRHKTDTIFPKMSSGIYSCFVLDIIKEQPEFITPQKDSPYRYSYEGKTIIDDRTVDIISFRQKNEISDPLFKGQIFIEKESKALVEARFEINPEFVKNATYMFIDRISSKIKIELQQAQYIVSYKLSDDGFYYINHIRGDLRFKARKTRQLFSSALHFWFEMVTCQIETEDVTNFPTKERLSKTKVFSETKHNFDNNFWQNFNIILPEEELKGNIIKNLNEIIITVDE